MDGSPFALLFEFLTHPVFVGVFSIVFIGVLFAVIFGIVLEKAKSEVGQTVGQFGCGFSIVATFFAVVAFLAWGINL